MDLFIEKFLFLYQNECGELKKKYLDGLRLLLTALNSDPSIKYLQWAAYMLATVRHECGGEWLPIREYSRGKGLKYGKPNPKTGQTYYGRGYVQLTWDYNYKAMGKVTGLDLLNNPDKVLESPVAYRIMSFGMRNGSFTGVGLSKYINETKCDYLSARKIINGMDCAVRIAEYAKTFERLLRESSIKEEGV